MTELNLKNYIDYSDIFYNMGNVANIVITVNEHNL